MIQIILFSAAAGIFATGLGAVISAILLKRPSENMTCWMLSFSAGVMTSVVCFGLVLESIEIASVTVTVYGLILGVIIIMILNRIVDKTTHTTGDDPKIHHTYAELYHEKQVIKNPSRMLRAGVLILIALALHNIPEGIAIGAGGSYDFELGALLTIVIALHNIPEGMAIAAPLLAGGITRWKVICLTALAGATTILGGFLGILIGNLSDFAVAMSLSTAGGAMLYVVFGEIIPQSVVMTKNRTAAIVTLFGIIIGLIITQI
ncbi:MAG: ZIP family metal transporter [Chitinispirillales bacterium]|nr:ZIP family metal transporter [Chitinispirillales bacterium]